MRAGLIRADLAERTRQYAVRFTARDRAGWLALFADDPEVIEPADATPQHGRAVLEQAFDGIERQGLTVRIEPHEIIVNGREAAMYLHAFIARPDGTVTCRAAIDLFTFDEAGRIARMRGHLGPVQPA